MTENEFVHVLAVVRGECSRPQKQYSSFSEQGEGSRGTRGIRWTVRQAVWKEVCERQVCGKVVSTEICACSGTGECSLVPRTKYSTGQGVENGLCQLGQGSVYIFCTARHRPLSSR